MEIGTDLPIHQTLHGYAEGHTLLAASCDLSLAEKKRLLLMSDLSGSLAHSAFISYLTAYPLPGQKYYAFARTWYANEMSRPGSVWTQTLLINVAYLSQFKHLGFLNTLFTRPQRDSYTTYSLPIFYNSTNNLSAGASLPDEMSRLYEQIIDNLYSKPTKKLLVRAAAPDQYEAILLEIWGHQWPRLRRRFSFCSGAFNLRYIDDIPLDCQIVPEGLNQSFTFKTTEEFIWVDLFKNGDTSTWIDLIRQTPSDQLLDFMYQYGSDVKGVRSRFVPLLYAYHLQYTPQLESTSFEALFSFFVKYFPSSEEGKRLKKELINRKLELDTLNTYQFVEAWLTSPWPATFSDLNWDIAALISQLWNSNLYTNHQVSQLLQRADPTRLANSTRLAIIQSLPIDCWLNLSWIDAPLLHEFLKRNSSINDLKVVWQASLSIQNQWILALENTDNTDWLAINNEMLMVGNGNWIQTVIKSVGGPRALFASLQWSNQTKRVLHVAWEKVIVDQSAIFFDWLAGQKEVTPYLINLIIKLFRPGTVPLQSTTPSNWSKVAQILLTHSTVTNSTQAITLLFSACLYQNALATIEIVVSLFGPLHERAKSNQFDNYSWQMLKSLEQIRTRAKRSEGFWDMLFFKKDNSPPEWDRCEYLRQITSDYYILYDWPQVSFSRMVNNDDVFKRIVFYCVSFQEGRTYMLKLKNYLQTQSSIATRNQLEILRQAEDRLLH